MKRFAFLLVLFAGLCLSSCHEGDEYVILTAYATYTEDAQCNYFITDGGNTLVPPRTYLDLPAGKRYYITFMEEEQFSPTSSRIKLMEALEVPTLTPVDIIGGEDTFDNDPIIGLVTSQTRTFLNFHIRYYEQSPDFHYFDVLISDYDEAENLYTFELRHHDEETVNTYFNDTILSINLTNLVKPGSTGFNYTVKWTGVGNTQNSINGKFSIY